MKRNASKRDERHGRSTPTNQSFGVCKVNLATLKGRNKAQDMRERDPVSNHRVTCVIKEMWSPLEFFFCKINM